jgi:hypothetical protein
MGHGKVEAFNRYCVTNFIAEVKASQIRTLDQLNEAFLAWIEEEYNQRNHSELGTSPKNRWMKDASRIQYLEEEKIRIAFLWREVRVADKTGVVRLFNKKYKVVPDLAKKKLQIRYDPERLEQIEIFFNGAFRQRAKLLQVTANRAPRQMPIVNEQREHPPTDYLGYLTKRHQNRIKAAVGKKGHQTSLKSFLAILSERIAAQVFDGELATEFYNTYGPFESNQLAACLDSLLRNQPANLHISFYLEHIHDQLIQGYTNE